MYALAAFVTGSVWVTLSTIIAERLGQGLGGLIIGLPSTTVVSFLFIALSESIPFAVQATTIFPMIYGFTGVLLALYAALSIRRGFVFGIVLPMVLWAALSAIAISFDFGFVTSFLSYVALLLLSLYIFRFARSPRRMRATRINGARTPVQIAWRAVISGAITLVAVVASWIGGPVFGGVFSAFPAGFIAGLIIVNRTEGTAFSAGMAKPMMLSGLLTSVPYALTIRLAYPAFGIPIGSLVAYGVSILVAVPVYEIIKSERAG